MNLVLFLKGFWLWIIKMIENKKLEACIESALAGGRTAMKCNNLSAERKESSVGKIHSIVSKADYMSQKAILKKINEYDSESLFMTEEEIEDERFRDRIVSSENLEKFDLLKNTGVYIIDELDGSSSHNAGHYEWSVSVGYVENLEHKAGAIFAPNIFGKDGALFYSSLGKGSFMRINGKDKKIEISNKEIKDSYVVFGADCVLKNKYPKHYKLMGDLSDEIRTTNMNGSGSLPLALVSAGIGEALVQPLQSVWDYAAGILLVREARGEIIFYEMDKNGECIPVNETKLEHYNPSTRNLGFIAGNKKIVPYIANRLFD